MKVKGIELFKMIADGKVNKDTRVNVDNYNKCSLGYVFEDGRNIFKWLDEDFEILEDKTEEIEKFEVDRNNYVHTKLGNFKGRLMDIAFVDKFNKLTEIVNKLNKQDTSKETNCMSE